MCECNKRFNEYGPCVPAGIRNVKPSCKDKAVIPSITVENTAGMRGLADCFVHVLSNNTTYYIDDKGRTSITWAGPVEVDNYDCEANPLKLRAQFAIDLTKNVGIYFTAIGEYRTFNLEGGDTPVSA